jgi:hypothetical protein
MFYSISSYNNIIPYTLATSKGVFPIGKREQERWRTGRQTRGRGNMER